MKKMIYGMVSCAFLCLTFVAQAQIENSQIITNDDQNAYVFKDSRIDLLVQQQKYLNTIALRNISGYRVQVMSTTNRAAANHARAQVMELFPEYGTYLDYQSPYFRVRVGDFIQKDSAEVAQEKLNQYFPNGVFTVRDQIKIDPKVLLEQIKAEHGTGN